MVHAHSGLRWLVLILLLVAIVNGMIGLFGKKEFQKKDKMINMATMALFHLQVLLGIGLIFSSGKFSLTHAFSNVMNQFYTVLHPSLMLGAAVILTIGYRKVKQAEKSNIKFRRTVLWFLLTLTIVYFAIPWPWFEAYGAGWF